MRREMVEAAFTFYPPNPDTVEKYERFTAAFRDLALLVYDELPDSRERSLAFAHLQEGRMCANAAIAIHTKPPATEVVLATLDSGAGLGSLGEHVEGATLTPEEREALGLPPTPDSSEGAHAE